MGSGVGVPVGEAGDGEAVAVVDSGVAWEVGVTSAGVGVVGTGTEVAASGVEVTPPEPGSGPCRPPAP